MIRTFVAWLGDKKENNYFLPFSHYLNLDLAGLPVICLPKYLHTYLCFLERFQSNQLWWCVTAVPCQMHRNGNFPRTIGFLHWCDGLWISSASPWTNQHAKNPGQVGLVGQGEDREVPRKNFLFESVHQGPWNLWIVPSLPDDQAYPGISTHGNPLNGQSTFDQDFCTIPTISS